eukprot:scaffold654209_cov62-Prasinocladus_malaysianus.AAC.2
MQVLLNETLFAASNQGSTDVYGSDRDIVVAQEKIFVSIMNYLTDKHGTHAEFCQIPDSDA